MEFPASQVVFQSVDIIEEIKCKLKLKLKERVNSKDTPQNNAITDDIIDLMCQLEDLEMTVGNLRETKIGKVLARYEKELPEPICSHAKRINGKWKEMLRVYRQCIKDRLSHKHVSTPPPEQFSIKEEPMSQNETKVETCHAESPINLERSTVTPPISRTESAGDQMKMLTKELLYDVRKAIMLSTEKMTKLEVELLNVKQNFLSVTKRLDEYERNMNLYFDISDQTFCQSTNLLNHEPSPPVSVGQPHKTATNKSFSYDHTTVEPSPPVSVGEPHKTATNKSSPEDDTTVEPPPPVSVGQPQKTATNKSSPEDHTTVLGSEDSPPVKENPALNNVLNKIFIHMHQRNNLEETALGLNKETGSNRTNKFTNMEEVRDPKMKRRHSESVKLGSQSELVEPPIDFKRKLSVSSAGSKYITPHSADVNTPKVQPTSSDPLSSNCRVVVPQQPFFDKSSEESLSNTRIISSSSNNSQVISLSSNNTRIRSSSSNNTRITYLTSSNTRISSSSSNNTRISSSSSNKSQFRVNKHSKDIISKPRKSSVFHPFKSPAPITSSAHQNDEILLVKGDAVDLKEVRLENGDHLSDVELEDLLSFSQAVDDCSNDIGEEEKSFLLNNKKKTRKSWNNYCKSIEGVKYAPLVKSKGRFKAAHKSSVCKQGIQNVLDKKSRFAINDSNSKSIIQPS